MKRIFVTLGSQEFQFNRLLKEIDSFIENGNNQYVFFAQIGYSDYVPKFYSFEKFLSREEFSRTVSESDIIVTHAGTGAIITALKADKPVIAFARLKKFNEHVDDHQTEILSTFIEKKYILGDVDTHKLKKLLVEISTQDFIAFHSNSDNFTTRLIDLIEEK